jgi:hypothetical protein
MLGSKVGYLKITIVTLSVTNRYTPSMGTPLAGVPYSGVSSVTTQSRRV